MINIYTVSQSFKPSINPPPIHYDHQCLEGWEGRPSLKHRVLTMIMC